MQRWHPWPAQAPAAARRPPGPQPTWLVEPTQPLRCDAQQRPLYAGALARVSGPHRVEAGWWDGGAHTRDYFVFRSATRGLLWIYRERLPSADSGWFLHGVFS
jgi:protein ImuB